MSDATGLSAVEAHYIEHFGHRPLRASVSFVGVEPIEVLRFEPIPGERAYVSLGMSRHPMTAAQQEVIDSSGPRAELMLHVHDPSDAYADVWRRVAVLAAAPAVEGVVYAAGMSVELGEPLVPASRCTGAVVVESPVGPITTPEGQVQVFQVVPATHTELGWCRARGSAALLELWREQDVDRLDLFRPPVLLQ